MKRIAIIGAGWFGLHITRYLKNNNFDVTLLEKEDDILKGSSSKNQNRLHLGFHYSRNQKTRLKNFKNNKSFISEYNHLVEDIKYNIYTVLNDKSIVDFGTYTSIFSNEGIPFKLYNDNPYLIKDIEGSITCDEKVFNIDKTKNFFWNELKECIILNYNISSIKYENKKYNINGEVYDGVINCTNNHFDGIKISNIFYEKCVTLIYECTNKNLLDKSLTLVDGEFYSIYPYTKGDNLFTVTHVKYTPQIKSKDIDYLKTIDLSDNIQNIILSFTSDIEKSYENFKKDFSYKDYFISYKTKIESNSSNRDIVFDLNNNYLKVFSGKILEIYELEKIVKKWLKIA